MKDYAKSPKVVIWEMTRACALACRHCRAEAIPRPHPAELTTTEAFGLVDMVAACDRPILVLTGGDPLMRDDLFDVVRYASGKGLPVAVSPSATGRLRLEALRGLKESGCTMISLSVDGPNAAVHDAFRGVRGSFERTVRGAHWARELGIALQINTTVSRYNHRELNAFVPLVQSLGPTQWSFFFLVPVGRAQSEDVLSAGETEEAFSDLYSISREVPFPVKTIEAPHYRRYVLQRGGAPPWIPFPAIGDGKGFVFVSHTGEIWPSGFLPFVAGNVRSTDLPTAYRTNPTMKKLRLTQMFGGKCGHCEFNSVCGGSRARAYTMTGDPFAAEPTCAYVPAQM
jgi:radical SAM protein with 4Fe4S-binding SPASM domain